MGEHFGNGCVLTGERTVTEGMAENEIAVKSKKITVTPSDAQDLWEKDWIITLVKQPEQKIGTLNFRGEKELGTVPIAIELDPEYQGKGYGTEALSIMTAWLFHFGNIYEIQAFVDRENDKGVKALQKAGYVRRSNEGRMETYSLVKPKTAWTGLYLFIGIFLGLILGLVFSHLVVGLIIGVVIGVAIGLSMDMNANKEREKVTGKNGKR